jgi:PAS domain S-box-containing protein
MAESMAPVGFRTIVDKVPDLITVLDAAATIRYASSALERILGHAADAVVGHPVFEFVHPDDAPNIKNILGTVLQDPGIIVPVELRVRHRDGTWRMLEAHGQSFRDDAAGMQCVVTMRSLAERRALPQPELGASVELAGGVAYEFNNLLTIIIARSDLVLRRVPADEEIRRNVDLIQRSAQRAAKLLQPFLTGEDETAPASAADSSRALRGSETILLVDDEEGIRRLLTETLSNGGYTVLGARHGGEAFDVCQRHPGPIHVMVTDVIMPQMSGRELVQRVRPIRPDMKVLYVSGYTDISPSHPGPTDSDSAFLPKPFMPQALAQKIREVLDHPASSQAGRP